MKRTMCFMGVASCVLAAGSLCAEPYTETFETTSTWTGGTVTNNGAYAYSGAAGLPLPLEAHTKVLLVEGDSAYDAGSTFTGTPMVDMMVQAARPDEPLELPEGEGPVQIAVAVDSNGYFNVYCKNRAGTETDWYQLSNTAYTDGDWVRVSLVFDYESQRCQVRLDGQPMMTANGFYNEATADTTKNGAWYNLATNTTASTYVSALKVIGCTAIDDVVLKVSDEGYAIAANVTNDVGVSCAWLDKYGLGWDSTTAGTSYDGTGMTVSQKYDACLSPFDGQTFEVKSVTADTSKGVTVVGIPSTVDTVGREVVLQYGSDSSFTSCTTTNVAPGQTSIEVALPSAGNVQYFRLRARDNK